MDGDGRGGEEGASLLAQQPEKDLHMPAGLLKGH